MMMKKNRKITVKIHIVKSRNNEDLYVDTYLAKILTN
jgi:hypothetical protein